MKTLTELLQKLPPKAEGGFLCIYGSEEELRKAHSEICEIGYLRAQTIESHDAEIYYLAIELDAEAWDNNSPFYESIEALWDEARNHEKLPANYYILKEKIHSECDKKAKEIKTIEHYLSWRQFLTSLKDHRGSEGNDSTLIYFISTDKGAKIYEVNPKKIKLPELLELCITDSTSEDLDQLHSAIKLLDGHQKERRDVLRTSLAELLEENTSMPWLITQGSRLQKKYKENYDVYLHKFSANKLLTEIEEKSTEYITKINDSISSSQTKAFAIPGAVIAVAALARSDDIPSLGMVCFSLLCVWILTVIANRIHSEAYDALAEQIKRSLKRYEVMKDENEVRVSAEEAKEKLLTIIIKSKSRLIFINDLAAGVLIIGIIYAIAKNDELNDFTKQILKFAFSQIKDLSIP
ncbi:hypothetical protein [Pseudomonas sp. PA27(2017)]|uniref:hypothetical protein n=1 Tax=Pseudomonas sp. PA27(2017) TaxID=1932112 RepID=UPI000B106B84|nr:hypothetical protein [Pseudomonas sp. PA27(2017)]